MGAGKSITVQVKTLDEVAASVFPEGTIAVLKIEAEGFEPEVLLGGAKTLARTELVTVDAGEERSGHSTAPACVNLLLVPDFSFAWFFCGGEFFFSARSSLPDLSSSPAALNLCPATLERMSGASVTLVTTAPVAELAAALINAPSPSGQEAQLADVIEALLRGTTHLEVLRHGNTVAART